MGTITLNLLKLIQKLQIFPFVFIMMRKKEELTTNHNMSINNKTKTCDKRTKRFSWSLEFNNDII
jgi:hypothetical protein